METYSKLYDKIVKKGMCTSCGACVGVCRQLSIKSKENPEPTLSGKCTNCNLCLDVCPALNVNFEELGEKAKNQSELIGNYYSTYEVDSNIKFGSSGGGITTILLELLKKNINCIIMSYDKKEPWKYEIVITGEEKDIKSNAGSKYQLSPMLSVLNELSKNKKYAFVGLPCQIQALRKIQKKGLFKNVEYLIGLFCGGNLPLYATEYLIKKLGVPLSKVKSIDYRKGSWEGEFFVEAEQFTRQIPKSKYNFLWSCAVNPRCLYCIDQTSELADISFGDSWDKKHFCEICKKWNCEHKKTKQSIIITRTKKGEKLMNMLKNKKGITIKISDEEQVVKNQSALLDKKKKGGWYRLNKYAGFIDYGKKKNVTLNFRRRISETLFVLSSKMFKKSRFYRKLVTLLPIKIYRVLVSQFISKNLYN